MTDCIIVLCTCPDNEHAVKIAESLVQQSIAACVNIVPGLLSVYKWKGEICRDDEKLLMIKTQKKLFETVRKTVEALHPYELPEIVAVDMVQANADYINWIAQSTSN